MQVQFSTIVLVNVATGFDHDLAGAKQIIRRTLAEIRCPHVQELECVVIVGEHEERLTVLGRKAKRYVKIFLPANYFRVPDRYFRANLEIHESVKALESVMAECGCGAGQLFALESRLHVGPPTESGM